MSSTRCTCARNSLRVAVLLRHGYAVREPVGTTEAPKLAICACRGNTPAHTHHQRAGCWRPRRCSWRHPTSESCSRAAALPRRPGRAGLGKPRRTPTASPQDLGPAPRAVSLGGSVRRCDHGDSERRGKSGRGREHSAHPRPRGYIQVASRRSRAETRTARRLSESPAKSCHSDGHPELYRGPADRIVRRLSTSSCG